MIRYTYLIFVFILLQNSCSSFFQKSWKTQNKELLKTIRVNLGKFDSVQEIKSNGKIYVQLALGKEEVDNILSTAERRNEEDSRMPSGYL